MNRDRDSSCGELRAKNGSQQVRDRPISQTETAGRGRGPHGL